MIITSLHQIDELKRASRYPKFKNILQPSRVGNLINNLHNAVVLKKLTLIEEAADPNDSFLISMSIDGNANYLVTGDKRSGLLQRKSIQKTKIVRISDFIEII